MVYRGRSGACIACKKRRKKCDQTRPSCLRCTRSNRTCTGYEESATWSIKQFDKVGVNPVEPFRSRARKCSLPRRTCVPGTTILAADVDNRGTELSSHELLDLAIRACFYDFCILPSSTCVGRGYLAGLEPAVNRLGPYSILGRACQAVTYINHGQALQRTQLVKNAESIYHEVIGRLAECIKRHDAMTAKEIQWITMLLGIYEISRPSNDDNDYHLIHASGLATFLRTENILPRLLHYLLAPYVGINANVSSREEDPILFSLTPPDQPAESLDTILMSLNSLWTRFQAAFAADELEPLGIECYNLENRFAKWADAQAKEARPTPVATFKPMWQVSNTPVGRWPGKVDTYPDLYIASVWNYARAGRLLLLSLMTSLSAALGLKVGIDCRQNVETLVCEIIASVPYHLSENLYDFISETELEISDPGRTLGGLLIMHPLFVASKATSVTEETRDYLRRCLSWISTHMGISQAGILASCDDVTEGFIRSACLIIWAGYVG